MKKAAVENLSTDGPQPTSRDRRREAAERIAIAALSFLAVDIERMRRFVDVSGLSPENIRTAAESPNFLAGVIDYLTSDESLLLAFAANAGIEPGEITHAGIALSGPMET